VCSANSLAELAADQGFSDQAHMTREFRHWLGVTPAQVRAQVAWRDLMAQSGYGDTLTGVQISIKNPSRSAT
jgi:AraC-like DNA-binding protein